MLAPVAPGETPPCATSSSAATAPATRSARTSPTSSSCIAALRKTEKTQPRQLVFYDPGVGTLARPDPWHKLRQDFNRDPRARHRLWARRQRARGLRIPGRQLRGRRPHLSVRLFPRRLHRARAGGADPQGRADVAAAGQSRRLGPDRLQAVFQRRRRPKFGLDLHALTDAGDEEGPLASTPFDNAAQFARITSTRWPTIHFVGVWDTVASVHRAAARPVLLAEPGGARVHPAESRA